LCDGYLIVKALDYSVLSR